MDVPEAAAVRIAMGSTSPVVIALGIVSAVAFAGAIIAWARQYVTFRGYSELLPEVRFIATALGGEIFRDGDDLVIAGNVDRLPATVRFSYQENTPGLNLRVEVPSNFTLSAGAMGATTEGKVLVRTGDGTFDARFAVRSDHPTQARMFLGSRAALADFMHLCCSTKVFLSLVPGVLELNELVIPEPYTGRHVNEHLRQIARLAKAMRDMPGAENIKIQPIQRERAVAGRLAIALGVVFAIATVVAAMRPQRTSLDLPQEKGPSGIPPAEARLIPGVEQWRLAGESDFDPASVTWLRNNALPVSGRVAGDFSGSGDGRDVAYILRRDDGSYRVVMLVSAENRYDVTYANVAAVARIPKALVASIAWNGPPPEDPDGDGLLLVMRGTGDTKQAVALFDKGPRIISSAPADYQTISF